VNTFDNGNSTLFGTACSSEAFDHRGEASVGGSKRKKSLSKFQRRGIVACSAAEPHKRLPAHRRCSAGSTRDASKRDR